MYSDTFSRSGCFLRFDFGWEVKKSIVFGGVLAPRRLPRMGVYSAIEGNTDVSGT